MTGLNAYLLTDINLTQKQARFLTEYLKNVNAMSDTAHADAYWTAYKPRDIDRDDTARLTSRGKQAYASCMKSIKGADASAIFEACNLGIMRFARELDKKLSCKKVEVYRGQIVSHKVGEDAEGQPVFEPTLFEDNSTQQKAVELLARVLGLDKKVVQINDSDPLKKVAEMISGIGIEEAAADE